MKRTHPARVVLNVDVDRAIAAGRCRDVSAQAVDLLRGMADQLLERVLALPVGSGRGPCQSYGLKRSGKVLGTGAFQGCMVLT